MMRIIHLFYIFLVSTLFGFGQTENQKLIINRLAGDFYVFTTFNFYKGEKIPANGLYVISDSGAVLIDSPWDTTQFQPLLDSIRLKHDKKVVSCIATHFHEDRTSGLEYYKNKGIKTYTTKLTDEWSKKKGMKRAEYVLSNDTTFRTGQYDYRVYYPGHGHAPDNIVIWFKKQRILYGGCLIKSVEDDTLGNLGDANAYEYANTVANVIKKCKKPLYVIPGHNSWHTTASLNHTLRMAKQLK